MVEGHRSILLRDDIITGLRAVGLKEGHHVVVHSRLRSFGYVEGGADTVIDALEKVVTDKGTLVMPAYSGQIIFLLESLALRSRINDPSEDKTIFSGSTGNLWEELEGISKESGIRYPFGSPDDLYKRLSGETRMLVRNGWEIKSEGTAPVDSRNIRLLRNAPPLPENEVKPWKMPVWTGIIPDTFWRRDETQRSHQYSGSFTAWGSLAETILKGHDNRPGQKPEDHPLYRLMEAGGKVLLLGVDHRTNSTIHVAQLAAFRSCKVQLPDSWKEFLQDFQVVDKPLDEKGGQDKGRIGNAEVRLADTRTLFAVVAALLEERIRTNPIR